jgi:acetyl-CoA/propionyl-CoA carboxylase biotin carboxyl carrier protein
MFSKILVANRGEIAVRIARTCVDLGVDCVTVYSDVDAGSRHVSIAGEAVHLPGVAAADTYLNARSIIEAAIETGAEAIHPGYGFLAESAAFAEAVVDAGLVWIGPPPEATRAVGDKISARRIAASAGVPVVPGMLDAAGEPELVRAFAEEHGYPLAVKAAAGGGGRGLKIARSPDEVDAAFEAAGREGLAYFGSAAVYVERYLESPKHLEVQVLAPNPDEALWLGVRDCSLQRRHQKLIEETPPPLWPELSAEMGEAAVALAKASGYVNAGTVEMLVDASGDFYFLEVNSRLQVEHTVTEEVFGIDLVACQLRIASGDALGLTQYDLEPRGHSIECRVNAEDPAMGWLPAPGRLTRYVEPNGPGIRVDSGYAAGDDIPDSYDSLIAKVVTWGSDREQARARMLRALDEFVIEGVPTTIEAHRFLLQDEAFRAGTHSTTSLQESGLPAGLQTKPPAPGGLLVEGRTVRLWNPSMAASVSAAAPAGRAAGDVVAPMQGTILEVLVHDGGRVEAGDPVVILEAMKMETTISAPASGVVTQIRVEAGQSVRSGETLAIVE